jgi:glutamate-1-semialdehyde 2,1-aminomutase
MLVVDEVTSGLRYGFPGASESIGLKPDIVVYAKAMSNGFPFGAIIGRDEVMQAADRSFISSSYWTDGVGPAAALAVLAKARREDAFRVVWQRGEQLQAKMREVAARYPVCKVIVAGMASTPSVTFGLGGDASLAQTVFVRRMQQRGFLVMSTYYVMLAHRETDFSGLVAAMDETLAELAPAVGEGRLQELAQVERGEKGFARLA